MKTLNVKHLQKANEKLQQEDDSKTFNNKDFC